MQGKTLDVMQTDQQRGPLTRVSCLPTVLRTVSAVQRSMQLIYSSPSTVK